MRQWIAIGTLLGLTACGGRQEAHVGWAPARSFSQLVDLTNFDRMKYQAGQLFKEMGGRHVTITSDDGALVQGIYFDHRLFKMRQGELYKECRRLFTQPRNCKLAQLFNINFEGDSLTTLFALPKNVRSLKATRDHTFGVICLPEYGLPAELDPVFILNYLARGMHVLLVQYRQVAFSEKTPDVKKSGEDAKAAAEWLKKELSLPTKQLIFAGKSYGAAPAIYAASKDSGSHLILDRALTKQSNYARITLVQGHVLIIDAMGDHYNEGEAAKIYQTLNHKKEAEKTWIRVPGGHHEYYFSNNNPSWYEDEKSHEKINRFLMRLK